MIEERESNARRLDARAIKGHYHVDLPQARSPLPSDALKCFALCKKGRMIREYMRH